MVDVIRAKLKKRSRPERVGSDLCLCSSLDQSKNSGNLNANVSGFTFVFSD